MNSSCGGTISVYFATLLRFGRVARCIVVCALLPLGVMATGCGGEDLAPVSGRVFYNGKPLEFGSVMLQPTAGPPATAVIQPDGSFELEVPGVGKGVRPGSCRVRVTCYEGQSPNARKEEREDVLGKSLIPMRYTNYTSNLVVEIDPANNAPLELQLTD